MDNILTGYPLSASRSPSPIRQDRWPETVGANFAVAVAGAAHGDGGPAVVAMDDQEISLTSSSESSDEIQHAAAQKVRIPDAIWANAAACLEPCRPRDLRRNCAELFCGPPCFTRALFGWVGLGSGTLLVGLGGGFLAGGIWPYYCFGTGSVLMVAGMTLLGLQYCRRPAPPGPGWAHNPYAGDAPV